MVIQHLLMIDAATSTYKRFRLHLHRRSHQFAILIVLHWVQTLLLLEKQLIDQIRFLQMFNILIPCWLWFTTYLCSIFAYLCASLTFFWLRMISCCFRQFYFWVFNCFYLFLLHVRIGVYHRFIYFYLSLLSELLKAYFRLHRRSHSFWTVILIVVRIMCQTIWARISPNRCLLFLLLLDNFPSNDRNIEILWFDLNWCRELVWRTHCVASCLVLVLIYHLLDFDWFHVVVQALYFTLLYQIFNIDFLFVFRLGFLNGWILHRVHLSRNHVFHRIANNWSFISFEQGVVI